MADTKKDWSSSSRSRDASFKSLTDALLGSAEPYCVASTPNVKRVRLFSMSTYVAATLFMSNHVTHCVTRVND